MMGVDASRLAVAWFYRLRPSHCVIGAVFFASWDEIELLQCESSTMDGAKAGGAVACAMYGLMVFKNLYNAKQTGYFLYIPLMLSCAFRAVAFGGYAGFYSPQQSGGRPLFNTDLLALWGAASAAGAGLHIAMMSMALAGWLKNVLPTYSPSAARPLTLLMRALVALCICFGPVLGAALAGVMYGSKDPQVQLHGLDIRKASTWGFFCVLVLLSWVLAAISAPVVRPRRSLQGAQQEESSWSSSGPVHQLSAWPRGGVLLMWPVIALILLSVIFKITATFHSEFMSNPNLYFPLVVTPEALSAIGLTLGHVFAQVGLGGRLEEYQAKQLPWQLEQAAAAAGGGDKAGDAEQGLPAIVAHAT